MNAVPNASQGGNSPASGPVQQRIAFEIWGPRLLVVALTLVVWVHSVTFDFVWDDQQFIVELKAVRSLKHVPEMFWAKEAQASMNDFNVFRPLRTIHYAVLFQLGGGEPPKAWLFHAANVLWHGAAALLLLSVARRLFLRLTPDAREEAARRFALFVAGGFAAHPVVSEVVCWAKSLDDAMAAVFTLAALRALLRWDGRNREWAWSLFWFALAVYSKESAVPFALVAPLIPLLCQRLDWRTVAVRSAGFLAIAFAYMAHRHFVIGRSSQTEPISGSYGQTLVDMLPVVTDYARLMLGAPPFHIDYSYMPGGQAMTAAPVLAGLVLLLALVAAAVWAMGIERWRLAGFGLVWCGLFLLPVSNLLPMMQYMAERFLYLPLVGWLLALGWLLARVRPARGQTAVAAAVILIWAGIAWQRSWIWRDALTLFVQSHVEGPTSPRVRKNAVAAIFGLPQVQAVFVRDKADGERLNFAAQTTAEQRAAALATLEEAERMFPDDFSVLNAVGVLRAVSGQAAGAVASFEKAVALRPQRADLWANLGQARLEMKNHGDAETALKRAVELQPRHVPAWQTLLRLYWEKQNYQEALVVLDKLKELEPGNAEHERWRMRARELLKAD